MKFIRVFQALLKLPALIEEIKTLMTPFDAIRVVVEQEIPALKKQAADQAEQIKNLSNQLAAATSTATIPADLADEVVKEATAFQATQPAPTPETK